ncbi:MAG: septal ring lytic transglycosylase RlpA family protein [Candidatus Limnocylindria bacterium]
MPGTSSSATSLAGVLALCGTLVFCVILLVPFAAERTAIPVGGQLVAAAVADDWQMARGAFPLAHRPARSIGVSALEALTPPAPVAAVAPTPPPVVAVAPAPDEPVPPTPEPPRASPAARALPLPLPPTAAPTPAPAAAPLAAAVGGGTLVLASWYGPGFYGNRTACGQVYTTQIQGVANRTLACGTIVTLTYGGRTVSVPVIDRGPYVAGRTLDLSNATRLALVCPDLCSLLMRVGN